jgi:hypothetical protein
MALLPGLPSLPPALGALFSQPALLFADTVSAIVATGTPQWGIYDQSGNPVLIADSVIGFEYKKPWNIADYVIERGGFTSYNKVTLPFDARFTFSQGGSDSDRAQFLAQIEVLGASLDLYNVVTPEITYSNANIEVLGYRRTAERGATLIKVDIALKQIRQTATQTFSQTAQPSGADQVNAGNVQPTPTPQPTQSALSELLQ